MAAITAGTQWEIRQAGSLNNGGGFDGSFGGTDYSQSNTPILTVTDAACSGGTTLTSATGGFTSAMVGNVINIVTVGQFQITAFTDTHTVALNSSPGTISAKTANVGGAVTVTTTGFGSVPAVGGNKVWIKADANYNPTSTAPTLSTNGTIAAPITWEGYSTVRGDGGKPVFAWTAGAINMLSVTGAFNIVKNLTLDGAGSSSTLVLNSAGAHCIFQGVTARNATVGLCNNTGSGTLFSNCLFDGRGISGDCFETNVPATCIDCEFAGAGASGANIGVFSTANATFINCISRNSANEGLYVDTAFAGSLLVQGCDIWNNGRDGVRIYSTSGGLESLTFKGNVIGRNGAYDVDYIPSDISGQQGAQQWATVALDHNAFFTTGTGRYKNLPAGSNDVSLLANPFVDDTVAFNFQLNNLAGAGALLVSAPWTVGWTDGINTGIYPYGALGSNTQAVMATPFNQAAPVIDEVTFPTAISRGLTGGATYNTVVTVTGGGGEQRVGLWARPRYRWEMNNTPKQPSEMQQIIAFFHAREGRLRGFRFRDWGDFQATNEPLTPTGSNTIQLIKTYTSGPSSTVRNIYKIDASPAVTLTRNGNPFAAFSLDITTGLVSPTADSTASITAITKAANAQVTTSAAHGFTVGQTIYFSGILGMVQLNGLTGVVQSTTSTTFTINVNSSNFSTYTSSGTASKFIQPGEIVTWTGNFTVPVRFDTDALRVVMDDATSWSLDSVPIVEIRP